MKWENVLFAFFPHDLTHFAMYAICPDDEVAKIFGSIRQDHSSKDSLFDDVGPALTLNKLGFI